MRSYVQRTLLCMHILLCAAGIGQRSHALESAAGRQNAVLQWNLLAIKAACWEYDRGPAQQGACLLMPGLAGKAEGLRARGHILRQGRQPRRRTQRRWHGRGVELRRCCCSLALAAPVRLCCRPPELAALLRRSRLCLNHQQGNPLHEEKTLLLMRRPCLQSPRLGVHVHARQGYAGCMDDVARKVPCMHVGGNGSSLTSVLRRKG